METNDTIKPSSSSSSSHHNAIVDITNVKLSEKFKKANVKFQATWGMWLDNAQSWAIYLNEMIDILHSEHPDWSIYTISKVIGRENDSLRGFSKTTIYRYLNNDNKALLDLTKSQNRQGKTKTKLQNNVDSVPIWEQNVPEESPESSSSSSSVANPELEEFRQQKGTTTTTTTPADFRENAFDQIVLEDSSSTSSSGGSSSGDMNDAIDSVYDLEDEEESTAEPHVIHDDPEKIMRQQEKQIKELIRANQNLEKDNEELREDYERVIPPYEIIETRNDIIDGKKRTQTIHVDPYKRTAWSEPHQP